MVYVKINLEVIILKKESISITNNLKTLFSNKIIKDIFQKIDTDYSRFSFQEKSSLVKAFHQVVKKTFNTDLALYINNGEEKSSGRSVFLSIENNSLTIDGLSRNPYFYLRDILLMHLIYLNEEAYDFIQVGNVSYNKNYISVLGELDMYNEYNLKYINVVKKFMSDCMINYNNKYVKDYKKDFDYVLTPLAISDMLKANEVIDKYCSDGLYKELKDIAIKISKMQEKKTLNIEETSLLALDEVVSCYVAAIEEKSTLAHRLNKHYKQFITLYFPEYSSDISIEINDLGIYINNRLKNENEMFLDVLFQEIAKIEKNKSRIDEIISDKEFNDFKDAKLDYNKLDIYFYYVCQKLDMRLLDNKYELINYVPFTKIYKSSHHPKLFIDSREVFSSLFENKEFIYLIEKSINCPEKDLDNIYQKIIKMLNQVYGVNFKLDINNTKDCGTSLGTADHEKETLYINVDQNSDRLEILTTFLHEYRHLMQYNEVKNNTGIYNKYAYEFIKLNSKESSLGKDHWYCSLAGAGYDNFIFYTMQPLEIDAEDFSYKMSKKILSRLKGSVKLSDEYFQDIYRENIYFNREMMCIELYKNYLKTDRINVVVEEEEKNYLEMINMIDNATTIEDSMKIFKMSNFSFLPIEKKIFVYQLILEDYESIRYHHDEQVIFIGTKIINPDKETDYQILEKILKMKAMCLVKEGKLGINNISKYIYDESLKYKAKVYDKFNALSSYDYHYCFDKYYKSDKNIKRKSR